MAKIARSKAAHLERATELYRRFEAAYPEVRCTLDYKNPFQLLVMTILAAQCTDARVNIVCKDLFRKYKKPADFLAVPVEELQRDVQPCGFYRNKAKNIAATAAYLLEHHNGQVPQTMEALLKLPGVGRKTANVILGECFEVQGVIVDTHCTRLANRLGFTKHQDAVKIERDLMRVWPEAHWTLLSHFTVWHGRAVCTARSPKCSVCVANDLCPWPDTKEGKKLGK